MLPTRKRSEKLGQFIHSFRDNADIPLNVAFYFLVDNDDTETFNYLDKKWGNDFNIHVILNKRETPHLGKFFNRLYTVQQENTIVSMLGDDMICRTKGWDTQILEAINKSGGLGIVHCKDGIQNGRIAVNLFTTHKWINALGGKFMPENWPADYIDVYHTEIARKTGFETYLGNVLIEHEHSSLKPKEQWDETFINLRAQYKNEDAGPVMNKLVTDAIHNVSGYLEQI